MRIGLTFDLRSEYLAAGYSELETAEFDREETIDAIESALRELGHTTDRIGSAPRLVERLAAGDRWELVFNICEGLRGIAREAQVPAVLDIYQIPYTFSDPLVMALSLHKGLTKSVVRDAGVPTPRFVTLAAATDAGAVDLAFPLFVKPVAEGTGKGISPASVIWDEEQLARETARLIAEHDQPVLVEEYLPGREFTVGLVGTGERSEVLGTLEIVLCSGAEPDVYSYVNKERCEDLVEYRLVESAKDAEVARAEALALAAWRALDCRDAGRVDLRSDAKCQPQFLEVNPIAGLHPTHSDLPMLCTARRVEYVELIDRIVTSARERIRPTQRPHLFEAATVGAKH